MKQLFNYSTVPGYEEAIRRTGKSLEEYLAMLGLDGIELLVYRSEPYMRPFDKVAVGQKRAWLLQIRRNIQAALIEKPEYLVYRVEEVSPAEQYSWNFDHTNAEVMKMAARVFNRVSEEVPADTKVLFENSWWPGLTLQNAKQTGEFLEKIKFENIGLMLDTGHLLERAGGYRLYLQYPQRDGRTPALHQRRAPELLPVGRVPAAVAPDDPVSGERCQAVKPCLQY